MEQIIKSNHDGNMYPIQEHPIIKDTAILPTRALEEFVNILRIWLDNLLPGGIVWGIQRAGKTQAIRYFIANSQMLLNNMIPVHCLVYGRRPILALLKIDFLRDY